MKPSATTWAAITIALVIHALVFAQLFCDPHTTQLATPTTAYSVTKMSFTRQQQTSNTADAQPSETNPSAILGPKVEESVTVPKKASLIIEKTDKPVKTKPQRKLAQNGKKVMAKQSAAATTTSANNKPLTTATIVTSTTAPMSTSAVLSVPGAATATDASHHASNKISQGIDPYERKTNQYINFVRTEILKHKHYPRQAKLRRHQGSVTVAFTLTAEGDIENIKLLQKSSSKYLNKSVRKLLRRIHLPAAEQQIRLSFPKQITLTLEFSLDTLAS